MRIILLFALTLCFTVAGNSQTTRPSSVNDLVMDCMKTNGEVKNKQVVIWFPYNFWEIIGEQIHSSPEFTKKLVTEMKEYLMFCVVDYTLSDNQLHFKSEADIRKTLVLADSTNKEWRPLADDELTPNASTMLENLKPVMAQFLGQMGEGMRIFLFKAPKENGRNLISVSSKNIMHLSWSSASVSWKLPLASMVPQKTCPVDNEKLNGTWNYCPVHGVKLNQMVQ